MSSARTATSAFYDIAPYFTPQDSHAHPSWYLRPMAQIAHAEFQSDETSDEASLNRSWPNARVRRMALTQSFAAL
jgi:hypothetical protein